MDPWIAYCGVNCAACPDRTKGACPGCRNSDWGDDPCLPVGCCRKKGIGVCGQCDVFPCADMAAFYEESESHKEGYDRMRVMRNE